MGEKQSQPFQFSFNTSSVSVQRGAPMAEPDRLQPGQLVATAAAAEEDRKLVADQLAAATGEDGRAVGCIILGGQEAKTEIPDNPFAGRWDLTVTGPKVTYPVWLEVVEKGGSLEVRAQPRTGNVRPVTKP